MDVTDDRNELPEELLELVFMHLQYVQDILRFGVVCRSWSFVASELVYDKGVEIQLEGTYGAWCCNSWNGWLLTIDYTPPHAINFLDIMSGYKFSCPSDGLEHPAPEIHQTPIEAFIKKVIASSAPSNPNCIFVAICCNWAELALCKPGDRRWTTG
ncbi:hypothetical protein CK203_070757 [Vitis vinifera]|uniref:F-box domain-containing protein n=1 Tax=Vitis vinifera TaxID=29760 RepID=A0A438C154_VITVI|nr:hypothetical protein CK203_070757 [Vitis vinifera]